MGDTLNDPVGSAIARDAPETLAAKARQPLGRMMVLACLAGAFIAFGSVISLVAQAGMGEGSGTGAVQLMSGLAFSVGLVLVMVAGAELFTGNAMMVLPAVTGALTPGPLARAWAVVWLGNLVGSLAVAWLFAASGGLDGGVGEAGRSLVAEKLAKTPQAIFCSAILANMLVCLAVWMSMNAATIPAKVVAIVGPVTVFVAAGLEHSIANMSLLPLGWPSGADGGAAWLPGVQNLALSTLGNIVGGSLLALGLAYGHDALRQDA
ncbi:formate/nitrite transporter family protein [Roseococcus sp. SYP-B2431]|uniref:formate/nitrite transporter family protein n=1 Tax=Roseococcus sp. SYP-B2431 TaxID=2496640 RepID=UPI00103F3A3F|nr:formate/nitrite transporter family protein [Roseococcus sp. SYP-B2431]TCH98304.1 formate/nitrite transporter family protein [Roseococcus sp. SYP-B2431]